MNMVRFLLSGLVTVSALGVQAQTAGYEAQEALPAPLPPTVVLPSNPNPGPLPQTDDRSIDVRSRDLREGEKTVVPRAPIRPGDPDRVNPDEFAD